MKRFNILLFIFSFTGLLFSQNIQKFSIDSGGENISSGGISILYTIGEVMIQERTNGNIHISEGFLNGQVMLSILIDPKLILQGPYLNPAIAGLMNDNLRANGLLPTTSPYTDGLVADPSVYNTTGNDAIVDWVWVELRDANDFSIEVFATSALLQRDGDVVALDGVSPLSLNVAEGAYYVVVDHRVHLPAMSASPINLLGNNLNVIDFKDESFSTYGNNAQVLFDSGDQALWTGVTNSGNQIRFSGSGNSADPIKDYVLADPANLFGLVTFSSNGYLNIDIDLNGSGRFSGSGNDRDILKDNVLAHPGNIFGLPTYTIQNTVPPKN